MMKEERSHHFPLCICYLFLPPCRHRQLFLSLPHQCGQEEEEEEDNDDDSVLLRFQQCISHRLLS